MLIMSINQEHLNHLEHTHARLTQFSGYVKGWDLGRGEAINKQAVLFAREVLDEAYNLGIWRSNTFAHLDGTIMLTFTLNEHDVEIDITPENVSALRYECNDITISEENDLSRQELSHHLNRLGPIFLESEKEKTI
jgi:hypothetical protein